jgi:hypothetical protein
MIISTYIRSILVGLLISGVMRESRAGLIIDTGPGEDSGGGVSLYTFSDNMGFAWLAGQFTISSALTLTAAQGWIANPTEAPWPVDLSLTKNTGGLPGQKLFTETFAVPVANTANWFGVADVRWQLNPGTYWITFAPQERPVSQTMAMPWFSPMPLDKTAVWNPLNTESWEDQGINVGMRVYGQSHDTPFTPVPEPAFYGLGAGALSGVLALRNLRRRSLQSETVR